jgi:hypothetical protein
MVQENTSDNIAENGVSVPSPAQDEELGNFIEKPHLMKSKPEPAAEEGDEGKEYPPARKVAVVMLALYLSLFLVSLVSSSHSSPPDPQMVTPFAGPHNNRHSRPPNHRRLPLYQ